MNSSFYCQNATAWRCFTFSKNPAVKEFSVHTDAVSKMSSPSVISHVMYASYDNQVNCG